ncbi:hypothetical protein BJX64DRAFT_290458 [Aspergillus heterothallicus]
MSLSALPLTILQDILILVLGLPLPLRHTLDSKARRTVLIGKGSNQNSTETKEFIQAARSLFIASRHFHNVAAPLLYSRTIFDFEDINYLRVFLNTIGACNRLNLRFVTIYLERDDTCKDDGCNEDDLTAAFVRKVTTTLSKLPAAVRGLWIYFPFTDWSLAVDEGTGTMHHPLRAALQRFRDVEELVLVGCPHKVPWDILHGSKRHTETKVEVSCVFPSLSTLRLEGPLLSSIGGVGLVRALSAANLPSLTHLEFQGVDDKASKHKGQAQPDSLVDAIRAARPLRTFRWLRGSEPQRASEFRGPPVPQFLSNSHICALFSRHRNTLCEVEIDLAGSLARDYAMSITEATLASTLASLPMLQQATILAPFLDLTNFLQGIACSNKEATSPSTQHTLAPMLESLRLTLGSEEDSLTLALHSGKLSSLFQRTGLSNISHLRLRVVVGTRPEITSAGRPRQILRDNVKLYPELQQALFACMADCRQHQSDLLTDAGQGQAARNNWCALSLVDIYDYSPFWGDMRDEWRETDVSAGP